jgi:hypothetical protein
MHLNRYDSYTTDFQSYEFYSEGPKGRVKKTVLFEKAQDNPIIYNLGFGDVDPETGLVSDTIRTDNKDRDKVLATVADTIHIFCDHYGNHYIYARGSTPVRTRLYQMSICRLWEEISTDFIVYGVINGIAMDFQKNVNYDGFLVKRK